MKIRWNWGTWIVISAASFMLMVVVMILHMSGEDFSLVEKDYYPKGNAHQELLNKIKNTAPWVKDISAEIRNDTLLIRFPDFFSPTEIKGDVELYDRVSLSGDRRFALSAGPDSLFRFPVEGIKGRFIIKIGWQYRNTDYYTEKKAEVF